MQIVDSKQPQQKTKTLFEEVQELKEKVNFVEETIIHNKEYLTEKHKEEYGMYSELLQQLESKRLKQQDMLNNILGQSGKKKVKKKDKSDIKKIKKKLLNKCHPDKTDNVEKQKLFDKIKNTTAITDLIEFSDILEVNDVLESLEDFESELRDERDELLKLLNDKTKNFFFEVNTTLKSNPILASSEFLLFLSSQINEIKKQL